MLFLLEQAVADGQDLDLGPHEAPVRVLRCADNRLPPHVETGIDQHRTASPSLKQRKQRVVAGIGVPMDCLNPSRVIHVGDGWNSDWGLARLNANGVPDPTFGPNGNGTMIISYELGIGSSNPDRLLVQPV